MSSKIHKISNILYAPWRYGQRKLGVESGSAQIMNIVNELTCLSPKVLPPNSKVIPVEELHAANNEKYHYELFKTRTQSIDNTLVIGGDHSIAVGSLMGSLQCINMLNNNNNNNMIHNECNNNGYLTETKRAYTTQQKENKLGVIWIDAHADINTLESSESGNIHGMPLAFITGIDKTWDWVNNTNLKLQFKDLYYWGIRDLDNFEIDIIDNYGIKVCVDKEEVMEVVDEYEYIHTSLDIDGLDPKYAPSTGTTADHGLELKDVLDYLYYLKFSNKSMGFDLVEYNPDIGTDEEKYITQQTVKSLLHAIL